MSTSLPTLDPCLGDRPQSAAAALTGGGLLARNTLINFAGRFLPLLFAIVAMPYTVRHLGPDRFGVLSLAWMVVGYFAFLDLGIGLATTKFVAEYRGRGVTRRIPELIWTAASTQLLLGTFAGILLVWAAPSLVGHVLKIPHELQGQAHEVFVILALSLPISLVNGTLGGALAGSQRFGLLNAVGVPSSALTYLVPAVGLALGFELPAIVFGLVLARLAALLALFLFCRRLYPGMGARWRFSRGLVVRLFEFGSWAAIAAAVGGVLLYFDKVLLGAVVSIASVGFYTPAYLIASKLNVPAGSFTATLFPAFSAASARGEAAWVQDAFVRSLKLLLLTVGPAAALLAFFAKPVLAIWLGGEFAAHGALALEILCGGVLANSLAFVPYDLLQAIGRPDLTGKLRLFELPVHLVLAWLLAVRYGLVGVALACGLSFCLDLVVLVSAVCLVIGMPLRVMAVNGIGRSLGSLAAFAGGLTGTGMLTRTPLPAALLSLVLGLGFLIAAWRYVLDGEERGRVRIWLGVAS